MLMPPDQPQAPVTAPPRSPPRRLLPTWAKRLAAALALIGMAVFALGFLWFVSRVPKTEIVLARGADGIVVVTGGASRIADAVELLSAGHGRRLLISGVHPTTTSREIARLLPEFGASDRLLRRSRPLGGQHGWQCDRDPELDQTAGFSIADRRDFQLPYAPDHGRTRLAHAGHRADPLPGGDRTDADRALVEFGLARLLFAEYLKYMFAQVRMRLSRPLTIPMSPVGAARSKLSYPPTGAPAARRRRAVLLRSTVFNLLFYLTTCIYLILALPAVLLRDRR